jgi:hypothetical protein
MINDRNDHYERRILELEEHYLARIALINYELKLAIDLMKEIHDRDASMQVFHVDLSRFIDDYMDEKAAEDSGR